MIVRKLINLVTYEHDDQAQREVERKFDVLKAAAAAVAAFVSTQLVRGFLSATSAMADQAETAERNARALNLTTQEYQELQFAFEQFKLEGRDINDVFNTLADRAKDVEQGSKGMIEDFGLIGLKVQDLKDKEPVELFDAFADAIANTEDVSTRNAAAVRILGDDIGNKLIPMLERGAAGVDELRAEARRLGLVMSDEAIENSKKYQRAMRSFDAATTGLKRVFLAEFLPALTEASEGLVDFVLQLDKREIRLFAQSIASNLQGALRTLLDVTRFLRENWTEVKLALAAVASGALAANFATIVSLVKKIATFSTVISVKWALLTAAILLAGLAVEDFIGFLEGKDSIIGRLLGDDAEQVRDSINQILDDLELLPEFLGETGEELGDFFFALANDTDQTLRNLFDGLEFLIVDFFKFIMRGFEKVGTFIGETNAKIVFFFIDAFNDLEAHIQQFFENLIRGAADAAKKIVDVLPGGEVISSGLDFVTEQLGGGAADVGVDAGRRLLEVQNNGRTLQIGKVEAKTEVKGSGLSGEELRVATAEGTAEGVQKALRQAANDFTGGLD